MSQEQNDMDNIYAERVSKTSIFINYCAFQGIIFFLYAQIINLLALMAYFVFGVFPTSLIISFT